MTKYNNLWRSHNSDRISPLDPISHDGGTIRINDSILFLSLRISSGVRNFSNPAMLNKIHKKMTTPGMCKNLWFENVFVHQISSAPLFTLNRMYSDAQFWSLITVSTKDNRADRPLVLQWTKYLVTTITVLKWIYAGKIWALAISVLDRVKSL